VRGEPDVGKKFIELIRGMGRQATEDIPEVREGIDVEVLAVAVEESSRRKGISPISAGVFGG
jgi:hypothetical protein